MKNEKINQLCVEVKAELEQNILPFWMKKMTDCEHELDSMGVLPESVLENYLHRRTSECTYLVDFLSSIPSAS